MHQSKLPLNQLFEEYVYHSFLYYQVSESKIPDSVFDSYCRQLLEQWKDVTHPDRGLADDEALRAGTGFQMADKWPKWVKDRARAEGVEHWSLVDEEHQDSLYWLAGKIIAPPPIAYYTGVGSRETPDDILELMMRFGKVQCDIGLRGRSGLAPGADKAFYLGAQKSERFEEVGFDNFLPNSWMFNKPDYGNVTPNPSKNIFDAKRFDNYEMAQEIACRARGSFNGLGNGGIELHTRNTYQVLGPTLDVPSLGLVCWAMPVGRKGMVKGGTNTAVQIAIEYGVEVINLYKDQDRNRIETYVRQQETKEV